MNDFIEKSPDYISAASPVAAPAIKVAREERRTRHSTDPEVYRDGYIPFPANFLT
jgi:hypothetical protein